MKNSKLPKPKIQIEVIVENEGFVSHLINPQAFCEKIANAALEEFEIDGEKSIDILLSDNQTIQKLNHEWRAKDAPTNVLSFPHPLNSPILGDIVLAFEYCRNEAQTQKKPFENHFAHLLVHGILHLLGYDHQNDQEAEIMENLEIEILGRLGINNPYEVE